MRRLLPLLLALFTFTACDDLGQVSTLKASLTVSPAAVVADPLWTGHPLALALSLTNTGSAYLGPLRAEVTDVHGPAQIEGTLQATAIAPGQTVLLDVSLFAPPGTMGPASGIILIDAGADGAIEVTVQANVRTPPICDDGNPCTEDRFDAALGRCLHDSIADGSACDDGSACTTNNACLDGRCLGNAVSCDDQQDCTVDRCEPSVGCVYEPVPSRCDDEDPCTADVCEPFSGCSNPPLGEGELCHFDGCNEIGLCFLGQCVLSDVPDGVPCEDGDACTVNDTCQAGECVSGPDLGIGAAPPLAFAPPEGLRVDLCKGPTTTAGGCQSAFPLEHGVERVLAVDRQGGRLRFVWQGAFVSGSGARCDPTDLHFRPVNLDPPDDEQPPPERGAPVPPSLHVCAAGVFLTTAVLTPSWSDPTTTQLTAVRGPAAAAFPLASAGLGDTFTPAEPPDPSLPPVADVVIAHPDFSRTSVWIEERQDDGTLLRSVRETPQGTSQYYVERVAHLAVAADEELITVVAHSDELTLPETCAAEGCVGVNVNVPLWVHEQPRYFNYPGLSRVLHLTRTIDAAGGGLPEQVNPVPLVIHELSVFATRPQTISLRMSQSAHGDVPGVPSAFTTHAAWRFDLGEWSVFPRNVPPIGSPLTIGDDGGSYGSFRALADGGYAAIRHVAAPCDCEPCLDPSLDCACVPFAGSCFDTVVERGRPPGIAPAEELLRLERIWRAGQAVPLVVEGELRVVTLLGDHLELLGTSDEGALSRVVAPPPPAGHAWEPASPLQPGPDESMVVLGLSASSPDGVPERSVLVQAFGCGLGAGPEEGVDQDHAGPDDDDDG